MKKQRHATAPPAGSAARSYQVTTDANTQDFACSGNGAGRSWNNRGANGYFWSSTWNSARNARNLNFNSSGVNPQNANNRYNGFPVRPVQQLSIQPNNDNAAGVRFPCFPQPLPAHP